MDNQVTVLPDGSAFATASWPLPKTHWLYAEGHNVPPMPLRMGTDNPERQAMNQKVRAAAKYAIRSATMNGKEPDFDPDALCQNMVVGLLGYHTADGLSSESWDNPPQAAQPTEPAFTAPMVEAIYAAWHGAGVDLAGGNWTRFVGMLPRA